LDETATIWNIETKEDAEKKKVSYSVSKNSSYQGHHLGVISVAVSASGKWMAVNSLDGTIKIWDVTQSNATQGEDNNIEVDEEGGGGVDRNHHQPRPRISSIKSAPGEAWNCCLANNDKVLLAGSRKGTVHVYDLMNNSGMHDGDEVDAVDVLKCTLALPTSMNKQATTPSFIMSVASASSTTMPSSDNGMHDDEEVTSLCAAGAEDGSITCYDLNTQKVVTRFAESSVYIHINSCKMCIHI
jgi:WD40 repeat protein